MIPPNAFLLSPLCSSFPVCLRLSIASELAEGSRSAFTFCDGARRHAQQASHRLVRLRGAEEYAAEIVNKLNMEINAALADPKMKARLADLGGHAATGIAGPVRQADRRRNREMGQGDPGRQHQAVG